MRCSARTRYRISHLLPEARAECDIGYLHGTVRRTGLPRLDPLRRWNHRATATLEPPRQCPKRDVAVAPPARPRVFTRSVQHLVETFLATPPGARAQPAITAHRGAARPPAHRHRRLYAVAVAGSEAVAPAGGTGAASLLRETSRTPVAATMRRAASIEISMPPARCSPFSPWNHASTSTATRNRRPGARRPPG
jgi:hypothetical protein